MILYLHGFKSSPASFKAQVLQRALEEQGLGTRWCCPQLPASPAAAMRLCHDLIQQRQLANPSQELIVIGSSLGGYYAHFLAEQWHCRAVVLNPAVHAPRDLKTQVGTHTMYHSDQPFTFLPEYVDELAQLQTAGPSQPERYFLLASRDDEVLNHKEMLDFYQGSRGLLLFGSDHGISDFELYLAPILNFIKP